jgi:hypothetical protein
MTDSKSKFNFKEYTRPIDKYTFCNLVTSEKTEDGSIDKFMEEYNGDYETKVNFLFQKDGTGFYYLHKNSKIIKEYNDAYDINENSFVFYSEEALSQHDWFQFLQRVGEECFNDNFTHITSVAFTDDVITVEY